MLFDLRSRGRRRTVQVIYLGLALLIGGGLILFGVGTGSGGGLLNGVGNSGSNGNQSQAVSQATKAAEKAVRQNPSSPSAWASLVQAQFSAAGEGNNYNTATGTYTAAGKKELAAATQSYQRYVQLTKSPDPNIAILAARAYGILGQYASDAAAWEVVVQSEPTQAKGYECLAVTAYAAHQTRKGDLAAAKVVKMVPKLQQLSLKQALQAAKTQGGQVVQQLGC